MVTPDLELNERIKGGTLMSSRHLIDNLRVKENTIIFDDESGKIAVVAFKDSFQAAFVFKTLEELLEEEK